ncbi:MAG: Omp28-related outer membrane protein [bacterium]
MKKILMVIMVLFLITNENSLSQIRRILFENFTGAWSGWDTDGFVIMDSIMNLYPDKIIGVRIHKGDSLAIPDGDSLIKTLGISGFPQAAIDRLKNQGVTGLSRSIWKLISDSALKVKPKIDIKIDFKYFEQVKGISITVNANIIDTINLPLKWHVYVCEDSVTGIGEGWDQSNYISNRNGYENHPYFNKPAKIMGFQHMKVVRKIIGGFNGYINPNIPVPILPGETYKFSTEFTKHEKWNMNNIFIVAFINIDSTYYYEVLNAASSRDSLYPTYNRRTDSLALIALYNSTDGDNWINNTNWLSDEPIDKWFGVTIVNGRVQKINLRQDKLIGIIPSEIGFLSEMESFELGNWGPNLQIWNKIYGEIPKEIGQLKNLKTLYMNRNELSGGIPKEIGNLANLEYIYLSFNKLTGEIPKELGNLVNLKGLYFYSNQLSGEIPKEIGKLSNLIALELPFNRLSGNIPLELFNLINLEELGLYSNELTGTVPREIFNLSKLWGLALGKNNLYGPIPVEIKNLKYLTQLWLDNCNFTYLPELQLPNVMDTLRIENNSLEFDDIEPNLNKSKFFSYSPQDSVGVEKNINVSLNLNYTFDIIVGGQNNRYQWFKDSIPISNIISSSSFTIQNISESDTGKYYCHITNTLATELTLYSRPFKIVVLYSEIELSSANKSNINIVCENLGYDTISIINSGNNPLIISDISISGDTGFSLVPSFTSTTISPLETKDFIIAFSPQSIGESSATLSIFSNSFKDSILSIPITGRKDELNFELSDSLLFLRTKFINTEIDTSFHIVNSGTLPIAWTVPININDFVIDSIVPLITSPGDTSIVFLKFIGGIADSTYHGTFNFIDSCNNNRKVEIIASVEQQFSVTLHVGTDSAKAGEIVEIPIYLRNASNLEYSEVENFTTDLVFNSTLLAPIDYTEKNILNGQRRLALTLPIVPISDSTLASIKFVVGLGNSESTELILENFTAIGDDLIIDTISGTFKLLGICKEGGDRLINAGAGNLKLMIIAPNPSDNEIEIEYELIEEGTIQIDIYNYQVIVVKNILKKVMKPGKYIQKIELSDLPQGTYFIIIRTPGYRISQTFVKVE